MAWTPPPLPPLTAPASALATVTFPASPDTLLSSCPRPLHWLTSARDILLQDKMWCLSSLLKGHLSTETSDHKIWDSAAPVFLHSPLYHSLLSVSLVEVFYEVMSVEPPPLEQQPHRRRGHLSQLALFPMQCWEQCGHVASALNSWVLGQVTPSCMSAQAWRLRLSLSHYGAGETQGSGILHSARNLKRQAGSLKVESTQSGILLLAVAFPATRAILAVSLWRLWRP